MRTVQISMETGQTQNQVKSAQERVHKPQVNSESGELQREVLRDQMIVVKHDDDVDFKLCRMETQTFKYALKEGMKVVKERFH